MNEARYHAEDFEERAPRWAVVLLVVAIPTAIVGSVEFGMWLQRALDANAAKIEAERPKRTEAKPSSYPLLSCTPQDRAEYNEACIRRSLAGKIKGSI